MFMGYGGIIFTVHNNFCLGSDSAGVVGVGDLH